MTHLHIIAAALLAIASPAWGQQETGSELHVILGPNSVTNPGCITHGDGICTCSDPHFTCSNGLSVLVTTCADPSKVLVGDKCVPMTDVDDAPHIQIPHRSLERSPNAIYT